MPDDRAQDADGAGDRIRRHVTVSGRVQGVSYRAHTRRQARSHGVDGWVRNRSDGRVEAVFEGDPDAVRSMVEWCNRGSPAARVERVDARTESPEGLSGFEIRY